MNNLIKEVEELYPIYESTSEVDREYLMNQRRQFEKGAVWQSQQSRISENYYKQAAEKLWELLGKIDTSTDIFKPRIEDPKALMAFYNQTNKYTAQRFDILKSDGYNLYTPQEFYAKNLSKPESGSSFKTDKNFL